MGVGGCFSRQRSPTKSREIVLCGTHTCLPLICAVPQLPPCIAQLDASKRNTLFETQRPVKRMYQVPGEQHTSSNEPHCSCKKTVPPSRLFLDQLDRGSTFIVTPASGEHLHGPHSSVARITPGRAQWPTGILITLQSIHSAKSTHCPVWTENRHVSMPCLLRTPATPPLNWHHERTASFITVFCRKICVKRRLGKSLVAAVPRTSHVKGAFGCMRDSLAALLEPICVLSCLIAEPCRSLTFELLC